MTTDYIGDGSPSTLAANLRQWVDSVPSHARQLLVAAADALVAPVAPAGPVIAVECWKCGAKTFDRAPVAPALVPLTHERDRPDQGASYVPGYGFVSTTELRAIEAAHGIKP